jgi:V/A-type H+-transporting ATPase subunit B
MNKWYKNTTELVGPIMVVEGVGSPMYEEMVTVKDNRSGKIIKGRVLEASEDKAVIQLFDSTAGFDLENSTVSLSGETLQLSISDEMLGRVFDGIGRPKDGGEEILSSTRRDINGEAINPAMREFPDNFIQTGVSTIDIMSTVVQGQKIPVFSEAGLPHNQLVAQIINQAKIMKDGVADDNFAIVFGAIGITFEEYQFFMKEFEEAGIENTAMFVNLASDSVVERITLPRLALTLAEYLAFDLGKNVLVILTDITNYCSALREISSARKEVPGRRGYPGYMYTDLAGLYERAGRVEGSDGSITQIPIITMPEGDKTHPVPDLTGYITEGQIVLNKDLAQKNISPPINILSSLSRMMGKGVGEGKTREDHSKVADQLFSSYSRGLRFKELAQILGEASLSEDDRKYIQFVDRYEQDFINQGYDQERSLEESLSIAWRLLGILPRKDLKKIKEEHIEKYLDGK